MSIMSLRLPESLHRRLREFAERDDVSINQLITTAVAEKLAALSTLEHLEARAKKGSKKKFLAALVRVPDREPDPEDSWGGVQHDVPAADASRRRQGRG